MLEVRKEGREGGGRRVSNVNLWFPLFPELHLPVPTRGRADLANPQQRRSPPSKKKL